MDLGTVFLVLGAAPTIAILLWLVARRHMMNKILLKAAEYAGYKQDNYEELSRVRKPQLTDLLSGICRQPERLAQRARWLAVRVRTAMPEEDVAVLETSIYPMKAYLTACIDQHKSMYGLSRALWDISAKAHKLSKNDGCPPAVRAALKGWRRDVLMWSRVARTLAGFLKDSIERESRTKKPPP